MGLKKVDVYVKDIENGEIWAEMEDSGFWLKPIKNVYVLTEDELQEFALQAKMSNLLPKQFIQSITK